MEIALHYLFPVFFICL